MRINSPIAGLFIGLIMPLLGLIVVYFILGQGQGFSSFLDQIGVRPSLAAKVISLSVLANLLPFMYFNRRRLDYSVRGIVIATGLYMLVFIYIKFVM